ncbi:laccase [Artemisia annua]|uniref:Laccase n=1 Tax=Artemisia annua TaxID=35608 RepID=A0A2U1NLN9_ARTAN|nr:laccase [Artemisia annua]
MNEEMALKIAGFLIILGFIHSQAALNPKTYDYEVKEANFTRLCKNKTILTVNGEFPGPTIYARRGETLVVNVYNKGNLGITIHWHGVKQPRYPWSDGPEFITQCPIQPGANFSQKIILSDEEGTLWWHAHSDWSRATVHGLIVIWPKIGRPYPFPKPYVEYPIVLAEWWRQDVEAVLLDFMKTGGDPNTSDALTVNGQPGDLYPCSSSETTKFILEHGKTYMLRMVNAAMNLFLFFGIAGHEITVVGTDGAYTKPLKSHYGVISPGQTIDILFKADQPIGQYYFAARPYNSQPAISFDNTTTTAIFEYKGYKNSSSKPAFPHLPKVNDTSASVNFTGSFRSLASRAHPIDVPMKITRNFLYTISINTLPCPGNTCLGPRGLRFAASVNNITFDSQNISILNAYYGRIKGVYGVDFPRFPPLFFNFTSSNISTTLETPLNATEVQVLNYNDTVQLVFQGTNVVAGIDHPMHLHGHSFYVVGWGFGNYNKSRDPLNFNLVDPPLQQTIAVPKNGWTAIRFKADNPGVWLMHCHLERHISWGMETVFITKNGVRAGESLLPPPPDLPPCT